MAVLIYILLLLSRPVFAAPVASYTEAKETYNINTNAFESLPLAKSLLHARITTFSIELNVLLSNLNIDISEIQLGLDSYIADEAVFINKAESLVLLQERSGSINSTLRDVASLTRVLLGKDSLALSKPTLNNLNGVAKELSRQVLLARSSGNNIKLPKTKVNKAKESLVFAEDNFEKAARLLELATINSYRQANSKELRQAQILLVEGNLALKSAHADMELAVAALKNLHNIKPWEVRPNE